MVLGAMAVSHDQVLYYIIFIESSTYTRYSQHPYPRREFNPGPECVRESETDESQQPSPLDHRANM